MSASVSCVRKPVSTALLAQTPAKQSACSSDAHRPALRARSCAAVEDAQQVLDVVSVLVRHHVGLRERPALGAEARAQLVEEPQVDVDVLVGGAVERPHRRGGGAAAALDAVREEPGAGRHVLAPAAGEGLGPVALDAVDEADDAAILALVRIGPGPALLREVAAGPRGAGRLAGEVSEVAEAAVAPGDVAAEEDDDQRDDQAEATAAHREPALAAHASAPQVFDLRRVELGVVSEVGHVSRPSPFGARRRS